MYKTYKDATDYIGKLLLENHTTVFIKGLAEDLKRFYCLSKNGETLKTFSSCWKNVLALTPPPPDYLERFYYECMYLTDFLFFVVVAINSLRKEGKI